VLNFSSPKNLANFIKNIGSDINKYNSFFELNKNYCSTETNLTFICDLCEKLNKPKISKYYTNKRLIEWWFKEGKCQKVINPLYRDF
jgi:hypothetical protein